MTQTPQNPDPVVAPKPAHSAQASAQNNSMWGGRFAKGPAELMQAINVSIGVDKALWAQDIKASRAHCRMLAQQAIIDFEHSQILDDGLKACQAEIEAGTFPFREEFEDIHMNIEARLRELVGPVAGRLHTARSRNDQVATDFKLWVRDAVDATITSLKTLQITLLDRAEDHAETLMPGFTHLQPAQPVTLGHHLMAYVEMTGRDISRFEDARKRMNQSPLGSAALAGSPFPIDRHLTAKDLGFDGPMSNSLDGVSDRDFALESLSAANLCALHLSRLAEEMVIWSTPQFGFIRLSDAFSTGSSIMPQKRNPDAAELVRAKTGRILGALTALSMVMKGLPLAYSKDMQEDKPPVFEAFEALSVSIGAMTGMVADFTANKDAMAKAASSGFSTATDMADWLVMTLKIPFREAHHITGAAVALAEAKGVDLAQLSLTEYQSLNPAITDDLYRVLTATASCASRTSFGGTAPDQVRLQIKTWKDRLA